MRSILLRCGACAAVLGAAVPIGMALTGADHRDGPRATGDVAADITDVYAWHEGAKFVAVVNLAGFGAPGQPARFDPDVLVQLHIDRAAAAGSFDQVPDLDVTVRFAGNERGELAVQVEDLPGAAATITGPIGGVITDGPRQVFAGLRDDPFFFDLDGFKAALAKPAADSTLTFSSTRDTFAGTNVSAIVLEMALSDVTAGGTLPRLSVWATSARRPGAVSAVPGGVPGVAVLSTIVQAR